MRSCQPLLVPHHNPLSADGQSCKQTAPFFNSPFASQSNSAHIPVSERRHFKVKFGFSVTCALLWVDASCIITDHIRVVKCIRFLFFFPSEFWHLPARKIFSLRELTVLSNARKTFPSTYCSSDQF